MTGSGLVTKMWGTRFVVVDDGMPAHPWKECRTSNNKVEGSGYCPKPG